MDGTAVTQGVERPAHRRALVCLLAGALVVLGGFAADGASAHRPARGGGVTLAQFRVGVGCVESGGRYDARNPSSGAYGKYQIMPMNWPVWAGWYLGERRARQTPRNQEIVARGQMRNLRRYLGSGWPRVAYWWLSGLTGADRREWSPTARWYVRSVMRYARLARTDEGRRAIPSSCLSGPGGGGGGGGGPRGGRDGAGGSRAGDRVFGYRIARYRLNLRAGPGVAQRVIGAVDRGTRVAVVGRDRDRRDRRWVRVELPHGGRGWIARWLTRPG